MRHPTVLLVLATILGGASIHAQVPQLVNYQGRVAVNGVGFDGTGQFKFALVNANGSVTYWSNNGTSSGGSEPSAAVPLTVTQGLYSLLLGDTAFGANMTNIPSTVFSNPDVRLRVWFNDGAHGSQLLIPDQRLAPATYLADGTVTSASVSDAAITAGKIAPAAVDGTNIAPASLDSSIFAVPGPPSDGQVLGYNNGSLTWTAPGGGVFSLNGTSAYYNGGSVGLGTSSPQAGLRLDVIGLTRLSPGGSGGAIQFGTPNTETGMTIFGTNRADIRFDDSTLKLVAGAGTGVPSSFNGITINTSGNVGIGTTTPGLPLSVRTASNVYGMEQTDGTIRLATFVSGSGGNAGLGTISNNNLAFFANNNVRMTLDTTGNVGIGTTNPFYKLDVQGGGTRLETTTFNGQINVNAVAGGQTTMMLHARPGDLNPIWVENSSGYIFYLSVASPMELHMGGNAYKTAGGTSWIFASDRRLKQSVRAYEPGLDEVLRLRPVRFRYRDDLKLGLTSAQEEVGFIAQEVREVIPDAVTEGKDGYLMLKADPIHWAAINAIQELNAKLEEQRAENAGLKQRLEKLEQRMNEKNGGAE